MPSLGIIIQARTGSSRMPGKVILPFFNELSIIDLLLDKAKKTATPVILATTNSPADDSIEILGAKHGVAVFRGSENNVLDRFVQAANTFGFNKIIRVCADNPFLDLQSLKFLIDQFNRSTADYLSFQLAGGKPSILTHFGFWAEAVRLDALVRVQELTSESTYLEHVTNYIYTNPNLFNVSFVQADPLVFSRTDIRMTLDTPYDFDIQQGIYASLNAENPNFGIHEIVNWLDEHPEILNRMLNEINKNKK